MRYSILFVLSFVFASFAGNAQNAAEINEYTLVEDVLWASPDGFDLTMDIYTPKGDMKSYPVLVIYHGGGWLINDNSIMDDMSKYIVEHGDYVVCNVNYRLLVDQDNTVLLNEMVEDAFGAVLWIKEHIDEYGGDSKRVAVTGDSAGGNLASMIVVRGDAITETPFTEAPHGFNPSYVPEGKSLKKIAKKGGMDVQAAIISYGSFDMYQNAINGLEKESNFFWQFAQAKPRSGFGGDISYETNPEYYKAISPLYYIPEASKRNLPPQLFTVGSEDPLTTPTLIQDYVSLTKLKGHSALYWEYSDHTHAFLDSGSNEYLGSNFKDDAPEAIDVMIGFLDKVFYE